MIIYYDDWLFKTQLSQIFSLIGQKTESKEINFNDCSWFQQIVCASKILFFVSEIESIFQIICISEIEVDASENIGVNVLPQN